MLDVMVISPEKVLFEGRARSVIFPGEQGVFEILPFHKPLLSRLVSGTLIIDGLTFAIHRGIVGLNHNKATVIVEE